MAVGFSRSAPPASPGVIEGVEARLGVTLPPDFRRFLERQNGGELEPNFFDEDVGVRYLYSAGQTGDEYVEDLESVAWLYSPDGDSDHALDPALLPIGEDSFSNLICLKVSVDDYGGVYFWDHEQADDSQMLFGGSPTASASSSRGSDLNRSWIFPESRLRSSRSMDRVRGDAAKRHLPDGAQIDVCRWLRADAGGGDRGRPRALAAPGLTSRAGGRRTPLPLRSRR